MPRKIPDPEAAAESAWKYRQRHREAVNDRARLRMREKRERLKSAPSEVQQEHSVRAALHRQNYVQRTKKPVRKPLPKLTPKRPRPSPKKPTRPFQVTQSSENTHKPPLPPNVFTAPLSPPAAPIFAPHGPPPLLAPLPRPRAPDSPTPLPCKPRPCAPLAQIPADSDDSDSFAPRGPLPLLCLRAPNSPTPLPGKRRVPGAQSPKPMSLAEIDAADSDRDSEGGWDGDNESDC
ncbi:hypothetical protein C8R47DRAFT_1228154 [Mycena vitilis]|nr:hypothetical protein C8R47DRAFT_1228135 [Mycena vitilis]KAJ6455644.1 hypothetical protein C8R47DRAFT_1228141 [Mycena vitilis]KAJ6455654.1 hypothetical protein C8R47DRAFT_1228154 [Mycena vitilis]